MSQAIVTDSVAELGYTVAVRRGDSSHGRDSCHSGDCRCGCHSGGGRESMVGGHPRSYSDRRRGGGYHWGSSSDRGEGGSGMVGGHIGHGWDGLHGGYSGGGMHSCHSRGSVVSRHPGDGRDSNSGHGSRSSDERRGWGHRRNRSGDVIGDGWSSVERVHLRDRWSCGQHWCWCVVGCHGGGGMVVGDGWSCGDCGDCWRGVDSGYCGSGVICSYGGRSVVRSHGRSSVIGSDPCDGRRHGHRCQSRRRVSEGGHGGGGDGVAGRGEASDGGGVAATKETSEGSAGQGQDNDRTELE